MCTQLCQHKLTPNSNKKSFSVETDSFLCPLFIKSVLTSKFVKKVSSDNNTFKVCSSEKIFPQVSSEIFVVKIRKYWRKYVQIRVFPAECDVLDKPGHSFSVTPENMLLTLVNTLLQIYMKKYFRKLFLPLLISLLKWRVEDMMT